MSPATRRPWPVPLDMSRRPLARARLRGHDRRVTRRRRVLLSITAVLLLALGLVAAFFDRLVIWAVTPGVPFDRDAAPPAPDYADPAAWSALPDRIDAADAEVAGLPAIDPQLAPVDVFYVHPTSYVGGRWNAAVGDAAVDDATDRGATRIQASAFNGCCAVYAPRYRQANMSAFVAPTDDGLRAIALAGDDVVDAFRHYLAAYNKGRPFIVAAHSQGAVLAFRLLRDEIAATPLRERLVVAYLIGGPLTEAALTDVPGLPICASAEQTGCVVAFNARGPGYRRGLDFVDHPPPPPGAGPRPRVCVNPLTWRNDQVAADRELARGAVFWDDGVPPTPRPGFASARCDAGVLRVELAGGVPRDLPSRLLDHALGAGNYHPIEFGLFYVDLRDNAAQRVAAFLSRGT